MRAEVSAAKIGAVNPPDLMADQNNGKSWIVKHKSAFLIFGLFISGVVLAIVGTWIETYYPSSEKFDLLPFLGKVLTELSLALIVGGIAAVFLSLKEVVELLSKTLAELFTRGEIASLLSPTARETLMEKLVQERLGIEVGRIEQTLYKGLIKLTDDCLKSIHLRDFLVTTDFEPHPTNSNFLCQTTTVAFRILTGHRRSGRGIRFPYRYSYRIIAPAELSDSLSDEHFLLAFVLTIEGKEFDERRVTRQTKDGMCTIKLEFEKEFDLTLEETEVSLNYKAAALKWDNTSISRVRYPTRGFARTIHYNDEFDYDCSWFSTIGQEIGGNIVGGTPKPIPKGLTTRRYDWLLPGEGVAIYWSPKQKVNSPMVKTGALLH